MLTRFSFYANNSTDCDFRNPVTCDPTTRSLLVLGIMGGVCLSLICWGYIIQYCAQRRSGTSRRTLQIQESVDVITENPNASYVPFAKKGSSLGYGSAS